MRLSGHCFAVAWLLVVAAAGARADVIVVSPVGTPAENGAALLDALDGIDDASADNPYLLKVEPGNYHLGTMSLVMKEYVDIEGMGRSITTISADGSPLPDRGTVIGANNAELRSLTVESRGQTVDNPSGTHAIAIYNASASPSITNVGVRSSGRAATRAYGIYSQNSFSRVRDAVISASGAPIALESYGVYNRDSSLRLDNVVITATGAQRAYGVFSFEQSAARRVTIETSRIFGGTHAIFNSGRVLVALSHLSADGETIAGGGRITLNGIYDDNSMSRLVARNDRGPSAGAFLLDSAPPPPGFFSMPPAALIAAHDHDSGGWAARFHGLRENSNGLFISTPGGRDGLLVAGGSKSAVVRTSQGARMLYTEESTGVWFSDYGFGQLQNGGAFVRIDPLFSETIASVEPYHVFLQAYGDAEMYVALRSPEGFEVRLSRGDPEVQFSYRLVAKRHGFEEIRLERAPWAEGDPNLYPERGQRSLLDHEVMPAE